MGTWKHSNAQKKKPNRRKWGRGCQRHPRLAQRYRRYYRICEWPKIKPDHRLRTLKGHDRLSWWTRSNKIKYTIRCTKINDSGQKRHGSMIKCIILVKVKTLGVLDNKFRLHVSWKYFVVTKNVMHILYFQKKFTLKRCNANKTDICTSMFIWA